MNNDGPIINRLLLICLFGLATVAEANSADARNGLGLARQWCAACHLVTPDQGQASTDAPTFASIGRRPGFDVNQLTIGLGAPHPQMPDRALSREESADIASYIESLR